MWVVKEKSDLEGIHPRKMNTQYGRLNAIIDYFQHNGLSTTIIYPGQVITLVEEAQRLQVCVGNIRAVLPPEIIAENFRR